MAKQSYTTGQVLTSAQMTTLQSNDFNQTVSAKVASYVLVASDAGTRITMSNVAATTITVNTSLFSAGDTLFLTNISTGVCTITAGTATVSTAGSLALNQFDSGTLYFTSTGVSIFFGAGAGDITGVTAGTGISGGGTSGTVTVTNSMATEITAAGDIVVGTGSGTFDNLPIGTTAQVLTADTTVSPYKVKWATPSSGGGLTLLATASPSAAASFNFTSISGSYKNLVMEWRNFQASAGGTFATMKLNNDSSGSYEFQTLRITSQGGTRTVDAADDSAQTSMMGSTSKNNAFSGQFAGLAIQTAGRGWLRIWNYTNTDLTFYDWHAKSYNNTVPESIGTHGWGGYDASAAITRIDVTASGGTLTGTCYLYGES